MRHFQFLFVYRVVHAPNSEPATVTRAPNHSSRDTENAGSDALDDVPLVDVSGRGVAIGDDGL